MIDKTSAPQIIEQIRLRHMPPEWAVFAELRCGTGYGAQAEQRIDALALNLYPSKARIVSYEVKTSRSDFMREIANPAKRAFAERVAGECYFATPAGLVRVDEVPVGWGLAECTAGGLRTVKAAMQRAPEPWPMSFVLAIARRSADPPPRVKLAAWKLAGRELTEDELVEAALGAIDRRAARKAEVVRSKEGHAHAAEEEIARLRALKAAVLEHAGWPATTAQGFAQWIQAHRAGLDCDAVRRLETARDAIDAALGRLKGGPA